MGTDYNLVELLPLFVLNHNKKAYWNLNLSMRLFAWDVSFNFEAILVIRSLIYLTQYSDLMWDKLFQWSNALFHVFEDDWNSGGDVDRADVGPCRVKQVACEDRITVSSGTTSWPNALPVVNIPTL